MKLFTRYLNSTAVRAPENEGGAPEKTPAELQRESIAITASTDDGAEDKNADADPKPKSEEAEALDEEDKEGEEEEEGEEGEEDKFPPENETAEQKKERIAEEKLARKEQRMQKRIDKIAAERDLTKAENERLKKQIEEKPIEGLTEEEVQRRAEKLASDLVSQRTVENTQKEFEKICDALHDNAVKADKKFDANINEMAKEIGPIPRPLIYALNELDNENGADVLAYLANNVDDAEEIYGLSERRMTQRLIRISDKIKEEKAKTKTITKKSAVPAPVTPIGEGNARQRNVLPNNPTQNIDDYVRIRNQQEADKRKARLG